MYNYMYTYTFVYVHICLLDISSSIHSRNLQSHMLIMNCSSLTFHTSTFLDLTEKLRPRFSVKNHF